MNTFVIRAANTINDSFRGPMPRARSPGDNDVCSKLWEYTMSGTATLAGTQTVPSIDDSKIRPIPADERHGTAQHRHMIMFGSNSAILAIVIGALAAHGLTLCPRSPVRHRPNDSGPQPVRFPWGAGRGSNLLEHGTVRHHVDLPFRSPHFPEGAILRSPEAARPVNAMA